RIEQLGLEVELVLYSGQTEPSLNGQLYVEHIALAKPVILGCLDAENASYVLEQLHRSADYALSGKSVGVTTAPVQKSIINDAGIVFSGHTE
ncbi:4-hydroxythreonine-4-phosphate dehydrogenase PdxA, partial [Salmonella enterica subsp. enterica serovar 1,4,[5],12:i:-]